MSDLLLVDGYNIIGDWEELKALQADDMGSARYQLVSVLSAYRPWHWRRILVVFDGKTPNFEEVEGVEVFFTGDGESADTFIERLTGSLVGKYAVEVATSDREESRAAGAKGAVTVSAAGLKQRLLEAKESLKGKDDKLALDKGSVFLDDLIQERTRDTFEQWRRSSTGGEKA